LAQFRATRIQGFGARLSVLCAALRTMASNQYSQRCYALIKPITIFSLFVLASLPAHANESVFSPTEGSQCVTSRSDPEFSEWSCKAPFHYQFGFADTGNVVSLTLRDARNTSPPNEHSYVQWRAAGDTVGKKIEWRTTGGRPVSAILRVWRQDSSDQISQELLVLKTSLKGSCRIGAIDAKAPNANEKARALADSVSELTPCLDDFWQ
jgi:hypothetical protein